MRTLVATVAGLLTLVALAVAVPLHWVGTHVADEDGYVELTRPLATDRELQEAFAAYLGDYVVRELGVLPTLQPTITSLLTEAATTTADRPGFTEAWAETQRRSHRLTFDTSGADRLTVDLSPMAGFVVAEATAVLPVSLTVPEQVAVPVSAQDQASAIDQVRQTPERSLLAMGAAAVAFVVTLLAARRRALALGLLGLGTLGVAGTLWYVGDRVVPGVIDARAAPSEFARTLQKLLADRATDSLADSLVWVAVGGGVLVVLAVLARGARGARR